MSQSEVQTEDPPTPVDPPMPENASTSENASIPSDDPPAYPVELPPKYEPPQFPPPNYEPPKYIGYEESYSRHRHPNSGIDYKSQYIVAWN